MKKIKKIEILQGQTTHGDVRKAINAAIDDINSNFVPASSVADGYMTKEQALLSEEYKNERLIAETTEEAFSVVMERGVLESLSVDIPCHLNDTANPTPSLITAKDYANFVKAAKNVITQGIRLKKLEDKNVPATSKNDGYMTTDHVRSIVASLQGKLVFSAMGPKTLNFVFQNGNGPVTGSLLEFPVHGGEDDYTPCDYPALISPSAFSTLSTVIKKWADFDTLLSYVPTTIMDMLSVDSRDILDEQYSGEGRLVFNKSDNTFLTLVNNPSGQEQYYRYSDTLSDSGYRPQKGKIYIYQNQTFVGVDNGLAELFQTQEIL